MSREYIFNKAVITLKAGIFKIKTPA